MKTFTATQLAQELEIHPKKARAILRKNGYQRPGTRWTFDSSEKTKLKAVLKEAMKPKKAGRKQKAPIAAADTSVENAAYAM